MPKPLTAFKPGDKIQIKRVGCGKNFKCRLYELGLFDGALVQIIKNDGFGPIVLKVFDSKIALGRGEAEKVKGERKELS